MHCLVSSQVPDGDSVTARRDPVTPDHTHSSTYALPVMIALASSQIARLTPQPAYNDDEHMTTHRAKYTHLMSYYDWRRIRFRDVRDSDHAILRQHTSAADRATVPRRIPGNQQRFASSRARTQHSSRCVCAALHTKRSGNQSANTPHQTPT
jgi:hypothetical protein